MNSEPTNSIEERFLYYLERALKHLYDPSELRSSPLARLLCNDPHTDPAFALRDLLIHAIESLIHPANVPEGTRTWRVYQILHRRYTEQQSQKQVATDLGLSIRQLQREERLARQVLAECLQAHYGLGNRLAHLPNVPAESNEAMDRATPDTLTYAEELQQLANTVPIAVTDLGAVIQEILEIMQPLMQAYQVSVQTSLAPDLPGLPLKTLLLRQALLDLVGMAARRATKGQVVIKVERAEQVVSIRISSAPWNVSELDARPTQEGLDIAEKLIGLCGGELRRTDTLTFCVQITFPIEERFTVLVIDDNADTRLLFQRYLAGSRYQVVGAADGQQGVKLAQELCPDVILLDIMMPEHDGWEILGQLRVHPQTRSIPVFVCTILAQEELALAVGAAQFIRKPVSQSTLLTALERQIRPTHPESG